MSFVSRKAGSIKKDMRVKMELRGRCGIPISDIPFGPNSPKIAVDNNASRELVTNLVRDGIDVVFWARDEADEEWVDNAIDLGARVFLSHDIDVEHICREARIPFIELRKEFRSGSQFGHIVRELYKYGYRWRDKWHENETDETVYEELRRG